MGATVNRLRGDLAMKIKLYALFFGMSLFTAIFALTQRAYGTLGGSVDSIESDRNTLSAVRHAATVGKGFTVQEVGSGSSTVREYVSQSGVVFGIAWNGLVHPDLMQLLGSYSGEYYEALRQTPHKPGRRRLQVKTDRVVVEKWGHMRNLQGRAYAPALIPKGVSVDEIR
jgi:hypothetical protein